MRGNQFGKMISMTSFGESHGEALGVVLDGVPSGLKFSLDDLQKDLDRLQTAHIPVDVIFNQGASVLGLQ